MAPQKVLAGFPRLGQKNRSLPCAAFTALSRRCSCTFSFALMITNELLAAGRIIRQPAGQTSGYWVGCPGAYFDSGEKAWYLTYRIRRPRGVAPDRGGEVRVARSTDLERWDDVVTIHKDHYQSASIERSCLHRGQDGQWRYFTSFVSPSDGRWCTAVIKARTVAELNPANHRVIFSGPPLGLEGVKDPWILELDGVYHLFLSVATPTLNTGEGSHASLDIFNTGECKSATALAVSRDLDHWEWQGVIFAPGNTDWDCYCRRINSVVAIPWSRDALIADGANGPAKTPRFLAFYDGSASHLENYEEKCGLAVSDDLRTWRSISPHGPVVTSPHASKSLRYIDAKPTQGGWILFYEFARLDGAHDMRMMRCDDAALTALVR